MLPWRLSGDCKRWSVVQYIFASFEAMVSIHKFTRISFKFAVSGQKIIELIGQDVTDQCIWSKGNFK